MSSVTISRIVEWSPNGVTGFDASTRQLIYAADLQQLAADFGGGPIVVAVSRRSSFVKALRVPNAGANEIDMILRTQMASMFPVPLNELAYDFRLTNDLDADGRLAVVAAVRETDLVRILADAKSAGFKVARVVPAGFGAMALSEALGYPDAAVVESCSEGLAIDIVAGNELRYSRVAPMPKSAAEIAPEIDRSFAAIGLPVTATIAAGGLAIPKSTAVSAMPTLEALAGANLEKIGIDLEPAEIRMKKARAAQNNRVRLAVLLCASSLLLALLAYDGYSKNAELVRIANGKWQKQLNDLRKERKNLEDDVAVLQAKNGSLVRAFEPAQRPAEVLTVVSNHLPKSAWLSGITFDRGKTMYIRGTSTTSEGVAQYLQALTTEPRLRDVKLVFANNGDIEKTPVVQFSIQAFPVGNLPLVDAKKKGVKK